MEGLCFFWRFTGFRTFALLVGATSRRRWDWGNGGMMLTGEKRSASRKTWPSANLPAKYVSWPDLGSNQGLGCERLASDRLILQAWISFEQYIALQLVHHRKHSPRPLQIGSVWCSRKRIVIHCQNRRQHMNALFEKKVQNFWILTVVISNPWTGLDRPRGFQEVEAPRFQDSRHKKVVRLSALRTGHL